MRFIYMDEAGTSAKEPVSVVVGLVVHADNHWKAAEAEIIKAVQTIPRHVIERGFSFSAKTIWNNPKLRDGWPDQDRFHFLLRFMSIPRQLGIPICVAFARRGECMREFKSGLTGAEMDHLTCFLDCMLEANTFMNKHADSNEVATLIAEDVPRMRTFMRRMVDTFKQPIGYIHKDFIDTGKVPEHLENDHRRILDRIIDQIHFIEKHDSPILWLADACAFAFRRFLSGQANGDEFVKAVVGRNLPRRPENNNSTTFVAN